MLGLCGTCIQMTTVCTAARPVHLRCSVVVVYVAKTLPAGLSGRRAPFSIWGCNWSRRFSVTRVINLSWTHFYPEVGGNLFLQITGGYPRDCI